MSIKSCLFPSRWSCSPLLLICRVVVLLAVVVLAVVLALRGCPPGLVLVLVAGGVAAADRLAAIQDVRLTAVLPLP